MRGVGALGRLAVLLAGMILLLCAWGAAGAEEIVYDRAYVRQMADYGIYYLFDIETGTVKQFKTNESTVLVGTFTGDLRGGLDIRYRQDWHESFRLKNPTDETTAVLTDYSGFSFEYLLTDTAAAVLLLRNGSYTEIRME